MLYTRKGDDGSSSLFGKKTRIHKSDPVFEALGSLDELNSLLGFCRAFCSRKKIKELDIGEIVLDIQEKLFIAQAELAGAPKSIHPDRTKEAERIIDSIEERIRRPQSFIIPGATELSGLLDYARAMSRRVERSVVRTGQASPSTLAYLNRLSSLLYALARFEAYEAGHFETSPKYE